MFTKNAIRAIMTAMICDEVSSCGIYEIRNTADGKVYIGSAERFEKRWRSHRNDLRRGLHTNNHLQRAWTKYGESVFEFSQLLTCPKDNLVFWEQLAIDAYSEWLGPENMYNAN